MENISKNLVLAVLITIAQTREFDTDMITDRIRQIIDEWKTKYPNLKMKYENIKYDSLVNFNVSFTGEIEHLNLDTNR